MRYLCKLEGDRSATILRLGPEILCVFDHLPNSHAGLTLHTRTKVLSVPRANSHSMAIIR